MASKCSSIEIAARRGFAALADPTRLAVFELLAEGATSVGKLASHVEVSRPAVSQHLRVLKAAGLVNATAKGTLRVYRVEPDGLEALRAYLLELVERAAASAL